MWLYAAVTAGVGLYRYIQMYSDVLLVDVPALTPRCLWSIRCALTSASHTLCNRDIRGKLIIQATEQRSLSKTLQRKVNSFAARSDTRCESFK